MDLEVTADQEELRRGIRAVLAAECSPAAVREIVEARVAGKDAPATALWQHQRDLGWPALTIPEAAGGIGLGAVELGLLAEALGAALAPGPLFVTMSQLVPAVVETGVATATPAGSVLPAVAAGERTGTLALADGGGFDVRAVTATATPAGDGFVLAGTKRHVMDAAEVDDLVVVARTPGSSGAAGVGAFLVPVAATQMQSVASLDPTRGLATIELDGVEVAPEGVLGEPGETTAAALERATQVATVALALSAVGTAQALFDISLEYAKEREQFGVPIGSFQAIKHKFADMVVLLERARALGYFAALTIAEDDERRALATSMAKAAAAEAAARVAKEGIQIHGGIGYTWEHDAHLYVRRLRAESVLFGGAHEHRARVADLLGV